MAIVGPGAVQENILAPTPMLDGVSEFEYVTILNPLTDDFAIRVAQDVPVNLPFPIGKDTSGKVNQVTNTESDARQVYGLSLKNPDFQGRKHISNDTVIPAGETINLKGNDAQVAVRQLVNEILQREGKQRLMADPILRQEVEARIIQGRGSIQDLMDGNFRSKQQQLDEAIKQSNEVSSIPDEQPFAGLANQTIGSTPETSGDSGTDSSPQERRSPGRPRKTE
jgi:hypothetical protein